ncbi:hypothetical protein BWQ96_07277 [Gracilariopsis chorda]|uniref:Uncharacterized protein n=1 Tax=Gracilariopsis chorda TaxID=448386 RepID=A0A2V3ILP0_9FLOR|nr:hypothetical protein BWQ96_07277 [Gracilariopsis chorda]|eukprot:PXF42973.1 hypothetical protein BWQ96_07277 [Gracilariopsis chorda]
MLEVDRLHDMVSIDRLTSAGPLVSKKIPPNTATTEESEKNEVGTDESFPEAMHEPASNGSAIAENPVLVDPDTVSDVENSDSKFPDPISAEQK